MKDFNWNAFFSPENLWKILWTIVCFIVIYLCYRIIKYYTRRFAARKMKPQNAAILDKLIKYGFFAFAAVYILTALGINLSAVLGAAGIAGVAIGFAAQTSFSNIISGFFIFSEHSIQIGDFITVEDITGTVQSIDLLSVKILTPDNQMVRVPNETIIKANIINTTFHPVRRMTFKMGVAYSSDLEQVSETLFGIAKRTENVLTDPAPAVILDSFGDSAINVILAVWFKKENFLSVKNAIMKEIHRTFREQNISIAFPQMDIHLDDSDRADATSGSQPKPLPISEAKVGETKSGKKAGKKKEGASGKTKAGKTRQTTDQKNNIAAMEDAGEFIADEDHSKG